MQIESNSRNIFNNQKSSYTKLHITNNELIVLDVDGNTYMRKEFRKAIIGDGKEGLLQLMR
jgi:hypothetical protein